MLVMASSSFFFLGMGQDMQRLILHQIGSLTGRNLPDLKYTILTLPDSSEPRRSFFRQQSSPVEIHGGGVLLQDDVEGLKKVLRNAATSSLDGNVDLQDYPCQYIKESILLKITLPWNSSRTEVKANFLFHWTSLVQLYPHHQLSDFHVNPYLLTHQHHSITKYQITCQD